MRIVTSVVAALIVFGFGAIAAPLSRGGSDASAAAAVAATAPPAPVNVSSSPTIAITSAPPAAANASIISNETVVPSIDAVEDVYGVDIPYPPQTDGTPIDANATTAPRLVFFQGSLTTASRELADLVARDLLEEGLVTSVNIVSSSSMMSLPPVNTAGPASTTTAKPDASAVKKVDVHILSFITPSVLSPLVKLVVDLDCSLQLVKNPQLIFTVVSDGSLDYLASIAIKTDIFDGQLNNATAVAELFNSLAEVAAKEEPERQARRRMASAASVNTRSGRQNAEENVAEVEKLVSVWERRRQLQPAPVAEMTRAVKPKTTTGPFGIVIPESPLAPLMAGEEGGPLNPQEFSIAYVVVPTIETAEAIATSLLLEKLTTSVSMSTKGQIVNLMPNTTVESINSTAPASDYLNSTTGVVLSFVSLTEMAPVASLFVEIDYQMQFEDEQMFSSEPVVVFTTIVDGLYAYLADLQREALSLSDLVGEGVPAEDTIEDIATNTSATMNAATNVTAAARRSLEARRKRSESRKAAKAAKANAKRRLQETTPAPSSEASSHLKGASAPSEAAIGAVSEAEAAMTALVMFAMDEGAKRLVLGSITVPSLAFAQILALDLLGDKLIASAYIISDVRHHLRITAANETAPTQNASNVTIDNDSVILGFVTTAAISPVVRFVMELDFALFAPHRLAELTFAPVTQSVESHEKHVLEHTLQPNVLGGTVQTYDDVVGAISGFIEQEVQLFEALISESTSAPEANQTAPLNGTIKVTEVAPAPLNFTMAYARRLIALKAEINASNSTMI